MGVDDPGGVAEALARLAGQLHDESGVEDTVGVVVEFAVQALSCEQAGLVLRHGGGRLEMVAATDPLAGQAIGVQLALGAGPLVSAIADQVTVLVDDIGCDDRWPVWAAQITVLGLGSVLVVPIRAGDLVGGLSLAAGKPHAFEADDVDVAHLLARHASVAVASARQEETLHQAVDARGLIGQAQGILMERFTLDADRAFAILRRYSQDHNTKLSLVAQQLIDTRKLPGNHA